MTAGRCRLCVPSLLSCMVGLALGSAQDKSEPSKTTPPSAGERRSRVIEGYGGKIEIIALPNQQFELVDENARARYRTDAPTLDRSLVNLKGTFSYVTERGDRVLISADGARTTSFPSVRPWLTVREAIIDGRRVTREFTFGPGVVVNAKPLTGRWTQPDTTKAVWQKVGGKDTFAGTVELTDFAASECRVTPADAPVRCTLRRDGYRKDETLDRPSGATTKFDEKFPDGRRVEWGLVGPEGLEELGQAVTRAETFRLTTALGEVTKLTEVVDGKDRFPVRAEYPNGNIWTRPDRKDVWTRVDAKSPKDNRFFGRIERVGPDAVRQTDFANNQILLYHADGTVTTDYLAEETVATDDLRLESVWRPRYTVTHFPKGRVTVLDRPNRRTYDSAAAGGRERLTVEPKTGAVSFVNVAEQKVTIRPDGTRSVVPQRDARGRFEFDAGGRLFATYDAKQELTGEYRYADRGDGRMTLKGFHSKSGGWELWQMTTLPNGMQNWKLMNGANGVTLRMDVDRITVDGRNSFITEKPGTRRVETMDGTSIVTTRTRKDGTQTTAISLSTKVDGKDKEVYLLTTVANEEGQTTRQEFKANDWHATRGGGGAEYERAPWRTLGADGKPTNAPGWFGHVAIDDAGTLVRQSFRTEPDPDRPGDKRAVVRKDDAKRDRPVVESTRYTFTEGYYEEWFADGSMIRRDLNLDVVRVSPPGGDTLDIEYTPDAKDQPKKVLRVIIGGRLWTYEPTSGVFVADAPPFHPAALGSFTNVSIDSRSATVTWSNLASADKDPVDVTTAPADGATQLDRADGTKTHTDGRGRLVRSVDRWKTEYALEYDGDRLVRVDISTGITVTDKAYAAPKDRPLRARSFVGTDLGVRGWEGEWHVAYVDAAGRGVRLWHDTTTEERELPGGPVVRVQFPNGFKVVLDGKLDADERPDPKHLHVATSVTAVRGNGTDKVVTYTDDAGQRTDRFADRSFRRYDAHGRLVASENWRNAATEYLYADDGPKLAGVRSEKFELSRDPKTNSAVRVAIVGGEKQPPVPVRDFRLDGNGDLVIERPDPKEVDTRFEVVRPRAGRVEIGADASLSRFDSRDRLTYREEADGRRSYLTYDGAGTEPARRSDFKALEPIINEPQPSKVEFHAAQGAPTGVTRTTKGRTGTDVVTTIKKRADGKWVGGLGGEFDALWFAPDGKAAYLCADGGKTWGIVRSDGREVAVRFGADYSLLSRIYRNELGEVTDVEDSALGTTFVARNRDGEVVSLSQSGKKLTKVKDAQDGWIGSTAPGNTIFASLKIDANGDQLWTGKDGTLRTVRADGTVETTGPDRARRLIAPDGSFVRTVFAPGNEVSEATAYLTGDVEVLFDTGTVQRRGACSDAILTASGACAFRGSLLASETGAITRVDHATRHATVFHPDGRTTQFESAAAGWREPATGRIARTRDELAVRLREIGATAPGRADNAYNMSDAFRSTPPLARSLDVLPVQVEKRNPIAPGPTPEPTAAKSVTVALNGEELTVNKQKLGAAPLQDDLIKLFGKPSRSADVVNRMLTWDDLGVSAAVDPATNRVVTLRVTTGKEVFAYAAKAVYSGTLTIDGADVSGVTAVAAINQAKTGAKFEKMPQSVWSIQHPSKTIYLKTTDEGKAITSIEIGFVAPRK